MGAGKAEMTGKRNLSNADLVHDVVRSAGRPLTFDEIFERVNQRQPITTRNPKGTIRSALGSGRQLVSLGDGTYGYLPHLLPGSVLRLPLTEKRPADHPLIYTDEILQGLWPSFHDSQKRKDHRPVTARLPDSDEMFLPLDFLGIGTWGCAMPKPLHRFLVDQRAAAGDSLVVRIVDGEPIRCEIGLESRRQWDKDAQAARNRELADATAQLCRERGTERLAIWDLVTLLLARGAYRSELPPDPLATVLGDDSRFMNAGLHSWFMTESMTPTMRAEIQERQQLERELFGFGRVTEVIAPAGAPPATSFALERAMADVDALLSERDPTTIEEANALLKELLTLGGVPQRSLTTPLDQAQELMYDAWETASPRERTRLARRAIEISPDCADAYVLLAEETARSPKEAAELYAQGVAAGERALGKEAFEEGVGSFWGIVETRPYMRARLGLAQALWALGEQQPAIRHLQEMLHLNTGDNQGVRYVLLTWMLELDAPDVIQALLAAYPDDVSAIWTYGRALDAFRRLGDTAESRKLRAEARRWNRHVPVYLTGKKRLPRQLPAMVGMGDESEAIYCATELMAAWQATPGALAWVDSGPR